MITYRVRLDVPRELVVFVSGLLAAHRREIGTRQGTRNLGCYRQALFALAWTVSGADAIIALRCQEASSTWEAICNKPGTQTRTA